MRDFDRRFNRMRRIFWIMFGFAAILVLATWLVVGTIGVKVFSDPEGTAEKAGEIARSWKDAFNKGYKVVPVDESDTLVIDTLNVK
jgi:hypothetical protein